MSKDVEQAVYRYDWADVSPSVAVVEALGTLTDRDPVDLPTLNEVIDSDALDAIFTDSTSGRTVTTVSFAYAGHSVTVVDDGTVVVDRDTRRYRLDQ